jgi:hypothetical protein
MRPVLDHFGAMAVTAPLGILVRMQPFRLAPIGFLNIVPA